MSTIEQLEAGLAELRGERSAVEATMTKEDLGRRVDEWLAIARGRAAGSSRLVLGGQASGEHLEAVLAEDLLADAGLAGRVVARLEAQGFGQVSGRAKKQKLAKLEDEIAKVSAELRKVAEAEAVAEVRARFAAEGASELDLVQKQPEFAGEAA
jgi:hypothetical protein